MPEQVLFVHSRLIDETGGSYGIRDLGLLQSAAARPGATFGGKELYHDIFQKAAAMMESLAKNHPFIDGNKRTAITSAAVFLQRNGYVLETTQEELERIAIKTATGEISVNELAKWFKKYSFKR
ncbi:MAG: type II toxin-antitoxin system death-on-curing family toxin [Nitrospirae bacterium]|nr:type II toxin-antitoxin system death-on-curing family toxin [Nitrospirota bacterium]